MTNPRMGDVLRLEYIFDVVRFEHCTHIESDNIKEYTYADQLTNLTHREQADLVVVEI